MPIELGMYKMIDSGSTMATSTIVDRIIKNAMQFTLRNINKEKKEIELLKHQSMTAMAQADETSSDDNNNVDQTDN